MVGSGDIKHLLDTVNRYMKLVEQQQERIEKLEKRVDDCLHIFANKDYNKQKHKRLIERIEKLEKTHNIRQSPPLPPPNNTTRAGKNKK